RTASLEPTPPYPTSVLPSSWAPSFSSSCLHSPPAWAPRTAHCDGLPSSRSRFESRASSALMMRRATWRSSACSHEQNPGLSTVSTSGRLVGHALQFATGDLHTTRQALINIGRANKPTHQGLLLLRPRSADRKSVV